MDTATMDTATTITLALNAIVTTCAAVSIVVVLKTFGHERRHVFVEDLMQSVFEFRHQMKSMRASYKTYYEGKQEDGEDVSAYMLRLRSDYYRDNMKRLNEIASQIELMVSQAEMRISTGFILKDKIKDHEVKELERRVKSMYEILGVYESNLFTYFMAERARLKFSEGKIGQKEYGKLLLMKKDATAIVYGSYTEDDAFTRRIDFFVSESKNLLSRFFT